MKLLFAVQLLFLIGKSFSLLCLTIVKRYQPLFLIITTLLLIIFSTLLESILPALTPTATINSYDQPQSVLMSKNELQQLLYKWKLTQQLQPFSNIVSSQVENLQTTFDNH